MNGVLQYKHSTIAYKKYGTGAMLLFCFHGYGEDAESFTFLEPHLGKNYTLIAIDMPFHGQTQWNEGLNLTPEELAAMVTTLSTQLNTQAAPQQVSLLGYSMGGRIALQLLQVMPGKVSKVVLAAPDGLHKNPWYVFSTQTFIGNKLFRHAMYKPGRLLWALKNAGRYKLLHTSVIKIAHYYLDDASERINLFERWTTMRKFKPKLNLLKNLIKKYNIPVRFLFGKYDNIILSERSDIFKGDTKNIQVKVIAAGHRLLQEKYAEDIAQMFYA